MIRTMNMQLFDSDPLTIHRFYIHINNGQWYEMFEFEWKRSIGDRKWQFSMNEIDTLLIYRYISFLVNFRFYDIQWYWFDGSTLQRSILCSLITWINTIFIKISNPIHSTFILYIHIRIQSRIKDKLHSILNIKVPSVP